jgi:hypothetical protein
LLGQIRQVSGDKVKVYGSTGYVPQQAWLLNMSIRENILFGKEYDAEAYAEVIRVCSLQRDLTLFVAGDKTELAERVFVFVYSRARIFLAVNDKDVCLLERYMQIMISSFSTTRSLRWISTWERTSLRKRL